MPMKFITNEVVDILDIVTFVGNEKSFVKRKPGMSILKQRYGHFAVSDIGGSSEFGNRQVCDGIYEDRFL